MADTTALAKLIDAAYEDRALLDDASHVDAVKQTIALLDVGELRSASVVDGEWTTHAWVGRAILLYFAVQQMEVHEVGPFEFHDKIPLKRDLEAAKVLSLIHI